MIRRAIVALLLIVAATTSTNAYHAIHISFMQADWNANALTGKVSFYKDDLTKAVMAWSPGSPMTPEVRTRYLQSYFRVWTNGLSKELDMKVVKVTEDDNSYIFEFAFQVPPGTRTLTVDNRVLFREYWDQSNLIMLKHRGEELNYSFSPSAPTVVIPA